MEDLLWNGKYTVKAISKGGVKLAGLMLASSMLLTAYIGGGSSKDFSYFREISNRGGY